MELVGRDVELAAAARALEAVRGGSSRVLGVLGEAGIGKTALLAAIGERAARASVLVLEGRGAEHEHDVPFSAAADALDAHVGAVHPSRLATLGVDLGSALPSATCASTGPAERFRILRALRTLIELLGRERPVALLLDDLHWADEASIALVLHLLRRPPDVPHLLVFALRDIGPAPRLLDAARSLPGFEHLPLRPLGRDASLALLVGVEGRAKRERLARDSAGNPLFLRELARAAGRPGDAVPRTVRASVELELATLAPAPRTLIDGAAVVGDCFSPELAEAAGALDPDADALDALVAAGLVRATRRGREFAFPHPLVRRAVYDAAPPAWRLEAHERVAAALERSGAGPIARAHHVEQFARPCDEAAIALLGDAAASAASADPASAAHWYEAARRLLPHEDGGRRAELLAPMALALANAGRLEDSHAALVEVLELLPPAPTPRRLELVSACAQVETQLGRQNDARRRMIDALRGAPAAGQAEIAFELAADAMTHGRADELRSWADHARRRAEGVDPVLVAGAEALAEVGAIWAGNGTAGRSGGLDQFDDRALCARAGVLVQIGRAQLRLGRYGDAAATVTRGLAACRRAPQEQLLVWLRVVRAWTQVLLLDLEGALAEVDAAEESARLQHAPHPLLLVLCKRMLVHHYRGEELDAERAAVECAALSRALEPSAFTAHAACHAAQIRAEQDPERCIRELTAVEGAGLEATDPSMSSSIRLLLVRAAVAAGRVADAERWAAEAESFAARLRLPITGVRAAGARAEVLLARGAPARAAELALDAATAADGLPAPLDAIEARLLAGRALAAAGDREGAKHTLQQVAADAGRGGALRLRDAAGRELRRIGSRVSAGSRRAAGRADRDELTARERDVAALVTQGRSNKQVAATLFLSEKTVANTLTRVYTKLGVRSRVDLARTL